MPFLAARRERNEVLDAVCELMQGGQQCHQNRGRSRSVGHRCSCGGIRRAGDGSLGSDASIR
jgi:hypothetical protein